MSGGKRRKSTRLSSIKPQRDDSKLPKRRRTALCYLDGLPDDAVTLILSFGDALALRTVWFVCHRFRNLQITSDEALWRPHVNPLWKSASWISAREVWLATRYNSKTIAAELKPVTCCGCAKGVASFLTVTKGHNETSCILCLKDTSMVRIETAIRIFRLSTLQLAKLPHRVICPRLCRTYSHDAKRKGHGLVFTVRALRRASKGIVRTTSDIPSYIRKHYKTRYQSGDIELQNTIRDVRIEQQLELGKRYGLLVTRHLLPFRDEISLFDDMARRFHTTLCDRCKNYHMFPRQLMALALAPTTAQELLLLADPQKERCSIMLPSALSDLLVSQSKTVFNSLFRHFITHQSNFQSLCGDGIAVSWKRFVAKALESKLFKDVPIDRYYLGSAEEATTEFVCYLLEQPLDGVNMDQPAPLSTAERAFAKHQAQNSNESQGYIMTRVVAFFDSAAAQQLENQWVEAVLNHDMPQLFLTEVTSYSVKLTPLRLCRCYNMSIHQMGVILEKATMSNDIVDRVKLERVALKMSNFQDAIEIFRSIESFAAVPSNLKFVAELCTINSNFVISSLARAALERFTPESSEILNSNRFTRRIVAEFGGPRRLGKLISDGFLSEYRYIAMLWIEVKQRIEQEATAKALLLTQEEMENAGMVALGQTYECYRCLGDHRGDACEAYTSDDSGCGDY